MVPQKRIKLTTDKIIILPHKNLKNKLKGQKYKNNKSHLRT